MNRSGNISLKDGAASSGRRAAHVHAVSDLPQFSLMHSSCSCNTGQYAPHKREEWVLRLNPVGKVSVRYEASIACRHSSWHSPPTPVAALERIMSCCASKPSGFWGAASVAALALDWLYVLM